MHDCTCTKKQDLIQRVIGWNVVRDNTNFSHFNETKMLAEELFESVLYDRTTAKNLGRQFAVDHALDESVEELSPEQISDLADAYGDLIFIAIGSIYKLKKDPYEVLRAICDANDKKGSKKDSDGKIKKDPSFVEPVH